MALDIKKHILMTTFAFAVTLVPSENVFADNVTQQQAVDVRPGHARALRILEEEKYKDELTKVIVANVSEMSDSTGLTYLGAKISQADIEKYLSQLKLILGDDYKKYRANQAARDKNSFHLTLVSPNEYQLLPKNDLTLDFTLRITLAGLGRVSQGNNTAYFVVASSDDAAFFRQNMLLKPKDFHVTLGFNKKDVHGVAKGKESLIVQK